MTYYSRNIQFDSVSGGLLFRLPARILDALSYYGLHKVSVRMDMDPMLTALDVRRYTEVNRENTATRTASEETTSKVGR